MNRKTSELNDNMHQIDLTATEYYTPTQKNTHSTKRHTEVSLKQNTYSDTNLYTFKKAGITPCIPSDHNVRRLKIDHKPISSKNTSSWRLNNLLQNDEWVNEETEKENKKFPRTK